MKFYGTFSCGECDRVFSMELGSHSLNELKTPSKIGKFIGGMSMVMAESCGEHEKHCDAAPLKPEVSCETCVLDVDYCDHRRCGECKEPLFAKWKSQKPPVFTLSQIEAGCHNIGCDISCPACASIFFTGASTGKHSERCKAVSKAEPVAGMWKAPPYLFSEDQAVACATPLAAEVERLRTELDQTDRANAEIGADRDRLQSELDRVRLELSEARQCAAILEEQANPDAHLR